MFELVAGDPRRAAATQPSGLCQLPEDFLPPLRPAAAFCALLPPLPGPELFRLWLEPLLLPPRLEDPGELEIAAARDLLMPFLRRPSYCLSFLTLGPWSLAMSTPPLVRPSGATRWRPKNTSAPHGSHLPRAESRTYDPVRSTGRVGTPREESGPR